MQIRRLLLRNWRSVREADIRFEEMMVFIGKNNHGKSNILHSIRFLLGEISAGPEDFYDSADRLSVEAELVLDREEQKKYSKFGANNGFLAVRREVLRNGDDRYFFPQSKSSVPSAVTPLSAGNVFFVPAAADTVTNADSQVLDRIIAHIASLIMKRFPGHNGARMIRKLEKRLEYDLRDWGTSVEIRIDQSDDTRLQIEPLIWIDNGDAADAKRKQEGLRRSLLTGVVRRYADLLNEIDQKDVGVWFIIEEPELFLHPQAQRDLYESFKALAGRGVQVIFSTHSSFFIDLSRYASICITRKPDRQTGTVVRQQTGRLFSRKTEKKHFNMSYWINPDRGEMFFAKKVILVEGPTEKVILPKLAKRAGLDISEFTVIDCAGKTNMTMYITLLNKFRIPYAVVYDRDHQPYRSQKGKQFSTEQSAVIERRVDRRIGDAVVFVNDIEEELGIGGHGHKNKPFVALQFVTDESFKMPAALLRKIKQIFTEKE